MANLTAALLFGLAAMAVVPGAEGPQPRPAPAPKPADASTATTPDRASTARPPC